MSAFKVLFMFAVVAVHQGMAMTKMRYDSMESTDPASKLNYYKCKSVFKEPVGLDRCAMMKDMEKALTGCFKTLGLDNDFKKFSDAEGKYMNEPGNAFLMKEMKDNSTLFHDLRCCAMKANGMVLPTNAINMDKLIQEFTKAAGTDAGLTAAIQSGKTACVPPTDCNVLAVKKCFMDNCVKTMPK